MGVPLLLIHSAGRRTSAVDAGSARRLTGHPSSTNALSSAITGSSGMFSKVLEARWLALSRASRERIVPTPLSRKPFVTPWTWLRSASPPAYRAVRQEGRQTFRPLPFDDQGGRLLHVRSNGDADIRRPFTPSDAMYNSLKRDISASVGNASVLASPVATPYQLVHRHCLTVSSSNSSIVRLILSM